MPESNMRLIVLSWFFTISLLISVAAAGEMREIELTDGSTITGEVESLKSGVYTIKSDSLGTIRIEDAKIRAIRAKSSVPSGRGISGSSGTAESVKDLQRKMTGDKEIMVLIQSLQNDPDFKKILEDPEIMKAIQDGNFTALAADSRFKKLLNNPTVKEIEKKVN
jgi:hypothetical protein